jgi:lipopolysaccharide transport system ATP-binding protein
MSSEIVVGVKNLSKCYQIYAQPRDRLLQMLFRGRKQFYREFWALRDVSFEIRRGETVGIIGRNGSGKSTLLQMLCGTLTPTSGLVEVTGRVAALLELGAGFNPEFTGRENARMNMAILGMDAADIDARLDEVIRFAEIDDFVDQPVKTYSSGMYVRLAFSVAIHVDPDILVIDEALAVGDFAFQFKCLKRLKELSDSGVTILFVTHDIVQVQKLCSRVLYLRKGHAVYFGDTKTAADLYFSDVTATQPDAGVAPAVAAPRKRDLHAEGMEMRYAEFGAHVAPYRRGQRQSGQLMLVTVNGAFKEEPSIRFGDAIDLEIVFTLAPEFENPAIAFYVIDETGQLIVGSNTRYEGIDLRSGATGQTGRFRVSFENRLRSGRYGVQVYLVDFTPGMQTEYVDYIELAARFAAVCPPGRERWAWYSPSFTVEHETF